MAYAKASADDRREQYYADTRNSYRLDCEREPDKQYVFRV